MANTFELIAATTVGSGGASTIDFTSIPSTFTDLCLQVSLRGNSFQDWGNITINGGGTAVSMRQILNNSGSVISQAYSPLRFQCNPSSYTANTFSSASLYIPNYANTSYNKSMSVDGTQENNGTATGQNLAAGLWASTAAINQITVTPDGGGTFVQYSTAYLYGVKNA
jgi:hypothetical protein